MKNELKRDIIFSIILLIIGLVFRYLHFDVPDTPIIIEMGFISVYLSAVLINRNYLIFIIMSIICFLGPHNNITYIQAYVGNMLFAVPFVIFLRFIYKKLLNKSSILIGTVWGLSIIIGYQIFVTPIIWMYVGILNNNSIIESILLGYEKQSFLVESFIVSIISTLILVIINNNEIFIKREKRLKTILQSIGDAVIVFNKDFKVEMINKVAINITHFTEEHSIGKHINEIFSEQNFIYQNQTMEELAKQSLIEDKVIIVDKAVFHCSGKRDLCDHKNNNDIWISDSISPVKNGSDNTTGVVIIFRDVSNEIYSDNKNKKLELELNQSRKMEAIDQFSGGIAHDFNNIITVISGFTELMLLDVSDNNQVDNLLEIKKSCNRALNLTDKLLTLSRKQIIHPQIIQINEVIDAFLKIAKRITDEDIAIKSNLQASGQIKADISQLDQIFLNIIANSRDAIIKKEKLNIKDKKEIIINSYDEEIDEDIINIDLEKGKYVIIEIIDSGLGMSKETLQKAIEPFFTTKDKGKGTGLGLATVYGIIKQNKGALYIYSEENKETRVKIYWPKAEQNTIVINNNKQSKLKNSYGNEKILFVEDEISLCKISKKFLESYNYIIQIANNGEEALEVVKTFNPDIVVSDVIMPKMGGYELAKNLKTSQYNSKFLFMTGYSPEVLDGSENYIIKPYSLKDLVIKIRDVLDSE